MCCNSCCHIFTHIVELLQLEFPDFEKSNTVFGCFHTPSPLFQERKNCIKSVCSVMFCSCEWEEGEKGTSKVFSDVLWSNYMPMVNKYLIYVLLVTCNCQYYHVCHTVQLSTWSVCKMYVTLLKLWRVILTHYLIIFTFSVNYSITHPIKLLMYRTS